MAFAMTSSSPVSFSWQVDQLLALSGWRASGMSKIPVHHYSRIASDTRELTEPGALFVALRGENHDGHAYVANAVAKGVAGVVIEESSKLRAPAGVATFRVKNTVQALGQLASLKRRAYTGTVAAITGSAGKTSTKSIVEHLGAGKVFVSPGNYNNQIGVPLSIFKAPMDSRGWVLEMGMNAPGEIAELMAIVRPDVSLLLPAGYAHAGAFKSLDDIIAAKAEMLSGINQAEKVLVCGDQYEAYLRGKSPIRIGNSNADYCCTANEQDFPRGTTFTITEKKWSQRVSIPIHGHHWALSVAAGWALAREMKIARQSGVDHLEFLSLPSGRMKLMAHRGGWILDDSYNASPESYMAFLNYVETLPVGLDLRLVLGDMYELGRESRVAHHKVADSVFRILSQRKIGVYSLGQKISSALTEKRVPFYAQKNSESAVANSLGTWKNGTIVAYKCANGVGIYRSLRERGL